MNPSSAKTTRRVAAAACIAVIVLIVPTRASADPPLDVGGASATVGGAIDAVGNVVEDAPGLVEDVTDVVEGAVGDVAAPVDDVAEAVADAVDDVTETVTGAVDEVTDGVAGAVDEVTDDATGAVGGAIDSVDELPGRGSGSGEGSPPARPGDPSPRTVQPRPDPRSATWHRIPTPMDRGFGPVFLDPAPAFAPDLVAATGSHLRASALATNDPCEENAGLVCLGLLFGIGEFADAGTQVLGTLAMTGLGTLLLLHLAGGLLLAGSTALGLATRYRARPAHETG